MKFSTLPTKAAAAWSSTPVPALMALVSALVTTFFAAATACSFSNEALAKTFEIALPSWVRLALLVSVSVTADCNEETKEFVTFSFGAEAPESPATVEIVLSKLDVDPLDAPDVADASKFSASLLVMAAPSETMGPKQDACA